MNKKVSTILTCGLILGGSLLSSSAFADPINNLVANKAATSVEANTSYVLVQKANSGDVVYGFEKQDDGTIKEVVVPFTEDLKDNQSLKNFAWTIKEDSIKVGSDWRYWYTFHNVGLGIDLGVNADVNDVVTTGTIPSTKFVFESYLKYNGTNGSSIAVMDKDTEYIGFANAATDDLIFGIGNRTKAITFYEVSSKIIEGDDAVESLNGLYNKKGFNFDVQTPTGVTVENIFASTNKPIKAINVETDVKLAGVTDFGFPVGTYFTVSRPAGEEFNNDWDSEEKYNYLKGCTFIAVSPTNCAEVTPAARATGEGFQLVEVAGDKFHMYLGNATAQVSKDADISIYNACFEVEATLGDYPFSLDVKKFRYLEKESTDNTGAQKSAEVALQVINYASNSYALATKPGSNQFVFKYSQSSIASVFDFLEEGRTAAVYNIQFVSGDDDESENGKYLTFGRTGKISATTGDNMWIASGEALAQSALNTPAYQFVITAADAKTNELTFTNRESGQSFTTQLFKDGEANGQTYYSMAFASSTLNKDYVKVVNVDLNDYEVTPGDDVKFNDVQVVLTKSTVDKYAGFLNEEEGKMVTLNFGRDVNNTSNRLYAYVTDYDNAAKSGNLEESSKANVTTETSEAALWKLVRVKDANKKDLEKKFERSYAYELNGSVQIEPFGDVVAMPVYNLEYINDAEETDAYLTQDGDGYKLSSTGSDFIVRLNADGSVDLMGSGSAYEGSDQMEVKGSYSNGLKYVEATNSYTYESQYTYAIDEEAMDIKTYLGETSPIVSWPAEEGHVSIQSENGNYISMNEDRDGIVVANEAEVYYLHVTDKDAIVPSFYISRGMGEGSTAESERLFLFNPVDSAKYYVGPGEYNRLYSWDKDHDKALFKTGIMNATRDTLTLTVKGEADKKVAMKADNKNTWGGLNRFKFQIIETEDGDGYYYIRQTKAGRDGNENKTMYLSNIGDKLTWTTASASSIERLVLSVDEEAAPTANESVSASEVKVVAYDGAINIKNAAGKNVVVSTILGQIVANEVLTSDNATISVPAGIAIVSVDGEEAVKVSVR